MGYSNEHPGPRIQPSATASGLRVVAIGGGTGLSTLLKGLKWYVSPSVDRSPRESGQARNLRSLRRGYGER